MRKLVLLIADVEGWAFDNISNNITKLLSEEYELTTIYMSKYVARPWKLIQDHFINRRYDIVHFFWREDLRSIIWRDHVHEAARTTGYDVDAVISALCAPVITTSVYDHLFSDATALTERINTFCFAHGLSVSSSHLYHIYSASKGLPEPDLIIPDAVDVDLYACPDRIAPPLDAPLIVGWVGNSRWGDHSLQDAKGFHTILKPAIEAVRLEGAPITGHFADVIERRRSRAEMPQYYGEIDVLVCSSLCEGTPNPVLEAMAAGAAVVSTDVGIVRQCLGPMQQDFILPKRSVADLADRLRRLVHDRILLQELQAENCRTIQDWSWHNRADDWRRLWSIAGHRHADPRLKLYRLMALRSACLGGGRSTRSGEGLDAAIPTHGRTLMTRTRSAIAARMYRHPRIAATVNRLRGRT